MSVVVTSVSEVITADAINTAYERVENSDVRYRFVIDASTINAV
jgi:alcohol dehydrogenase (NADP+)